MDRVVNFYARLPRGAAPEVKPTGIIGRYQARYFGKNPSAAREYTLSIVSYSAKDADHLQLDSPRPRHRYHPDPGLQHGVLLPPPYVLYIFPVY